MCTCPCYKYNGLCKHSLCIAETVNHLNSHLISKGPSKVIYLVELQENAPGKKGNSHSNPGD